MSTRCNIIIKDRWNNRIHLYHHHDGYPEFVGALLAAFLGDYKPWQLKQYPFHIVNKLVKHGIPYYGLDWKTRNTIIKMDDEYEITSGIHGDIEYLYVINCKAGTLRCYEVGWDDKGEENGYEVNLRSVLRRQNLRPIPVLDYAPKNGGYAQMAKNED